MRRWKVLALLFIWTLSVPHQVQAQGTWKTDFSADNHGWSEVLNEQFAMPENPCRGSDGEYHWEQKEGKYGIQIRGSVPCQTVSLPSWQGQVQDLRKYAVETEMFWTAVEMDRNLLLKWRDKDNFLGFHFYAGQVWGEKVVHGQGMLLSKSSAYFPFRPHTRYTVRMEYDQSLRQIRLFINSVLVLEAFEPLDQEQLNGGSPGLRATVGYNSRSEVWFSHFLVQELGSTKMLNVERLSQRDPRWRATLYDHANEWNPEITDIDRWGCALVSAAMVLRSHGIKFIPAENQIELYPDSLNAWLLSQSDGYLGEGFINWRALTRLSYWHKEKFGTPALEFSFVNPSNKLDWLKQQIDQNRPVILAQDGHFIVGYGYGPGDNDRAIHDPFFANKTVLNAYDNTYLNARLFTPSYTDLSSLLLVLPEHLRVEVRDTANNTLIPPQKWQETLKSTDPYTLPRQQIFWDYPKLPTGEYAVTLFSAGGLPFSGEILSYTKTGEVQKIVVPQSQSDSIEIKLEITESGNTIVPLASVEQALISPEQFAAWLSTGYVQTPIIFEKYQAYQITLQSVPSEEQSLVHEDWIKNLASWRKNGWISGEALVWLSEGVP